MFENLPDIYYEKLLFTVGALLTAVFVSFISKFLIDILFSGVSKRLRSEYATAKTQTLLSLLKNVIDVVIFVIVVLIILSYWGIDIIPLLTGAGLVGLAISFGAQTLVKDIISGFFIILEDQYNVGDKIKVDKYEGEVFKITLRLTILRDKTGNLIYLPNSQVTAVIRLAKNKLS